MNIVGEDLAERFSDATRGGPSAWGCHSCHVSGRASARAPSASRLGRRATRGPGREEDHNLVLAWPISIGLNGGRRRGYRSDCRNQYGVSREWTGFGGLRLVHSNVHSESDVTSLTNIVFPEWLAAPMWHCQRRCSASTARACSGWPSPRSTRRRHLARRESRRPLPSLCSWVPLRQRRAVFGRHEDGEKLRALSLPGW
jgi:hypothetical protein